MALVQPADGTHRDEDLLQGRSPSRGLIRSSHLEPSRLGQRSTDPTRTGEEPQQEPEQEQQTPDSPQRAATTRNRVRDELIRSLKYKLLDELGTRFDPKADLSGAAIRGKIEAVVARQTFVMTRDERARLIDEMVAEMTGLGPIEALLLDDSITEVMVNGPKNVYIERGGQIQRVDVVFQDDDHVRRIIDRIVTAIGRRIDELSPRVDARLADGSRVNVIIPPLSLVGPVITIRKFSTRPYSVDDLIGFGTATAEMFDFIRACVQARLNVFVSGGTGSGKTTTLNVISSYIGATERVVTIEDAAELQLQQEHVVALETRPANLEGGGEINIRDLLRNALHMRPDRIIVGECRGGEALEMIQAMTSGQAGSLSTGHANSPRDMLRRLETMVLMSGVELPLRAIRDQIGAAVDLIVHTARLQDGSRKVTSITEVYGMEDDEILTQEIFKFEQTGIRDGRVEGQLRATGNRPTFMPVFESSGVHLPPGEFGIPPENPAKPGPVSRKRRWIAGQTDHHAASQTIVGQGRAVAAGGMVYVSSVGPVDPTSGRAIKGTITEQTRQCLRNLKAKLEGVGSSLDKVVWANWSLLEAQEFEEFNEEWARWFPGDAPVGQGTLMPSLQRRAGFRISIGVIAEA